MTKEQEEITKIDKKLDMTEDDEITTNLLYKKIELLEDMLKEKDKIIDLMAEYIFQSIDIEEDICNNVECKQGLGQDIICINCIIQYFKNKVDSIDY